MIQLELRDSRQVFANAFRVFVSCCNARSDRRRSHVDLADQGLCLSEPFDVLENRVRERTEFLAEGHGHRVLQLCAAHLQVGGEFLALEEESANQRAHRLLQLFDARVHRELDCRWINVVGGLAEVDVGVGADDVVLAALVAHELESTVGDYFIGVHVRGGSRATLEHVHPEVLVMTSGAYLAAGGDDRVRDGRLEKAEVPVCFGGGFLHGGDRGQKRRELAKLNAADGKILHRAQCLYAVQRIGGDVTFAEEIVLASCHSCLARKV